MFMTSFVCGQISVHVAGTQRLNTIHTSFCIEKPSGAVSFQLICRSKGGPVELAWMEGL